jgi:hypothetical protein
MSSFRHIIVVLLAATGCLICRGADTLIGSWRCETITNATVEFLRDGSFHLNAVDRAVGREIVVPMTGTYRIVDTNHIILHLTPASSIAPSNTIPFTLSYSLSGDELQLQTLDVNWGARTYHRVKK